MASPQLPAPPRHRPHVRNAEVGHFAQGNQAGSSMQVKASLYDIGATLSNVTIGS